MFLSLVIPSFLSIFKISFDEYVAAEESNVQGANVVKVQTVNNKNGIDSSDQSVLIDFQLPKFGAIQNLSQRPFKFPKTQKTPVSAPVNNSSAFVGPVAPLYDFTETEKGEDLFLFYIDIQNEQFSFYNGNNYDMYDVRVEITWFDGASEKKSIYGTFEIQKNRYYITAANNSYTTLEASPPYDTEFPIQNLSVSFKDSKCVKEVGASGVVYKNNCNVITYTEILKAQ